MQRQLTRSDVVAFTGLLNELAGQRAVLLVREHPSDNKSTEQVHDHLQGQIDTALLGGELGDVPRPNLVRLLCV